MFTEKPKIYVKLLIVPAVKFELILIHNKVVMDNGVHSPNFLRQMSLLFHKWLAERFNHDDA